MQKKEKSRKSSWQSLKSLYNSKSWKQLRSVGQGVKTPPFHGGNTGSNPVRTIWYVADGTLDEKRLKKFQKSVDKRKHLWYTNIVVAWEKWVTKTFENWTRRTNVQGTTTKVVVLNNEKNNKSVSDRNEWELKLLMRVWSWLRTNAGGVPNTCK